MKMKRFLIPIVTGGLVCLALILALAAGVAGCSGVAPQTTQTAIAPTTTGSPASTGATTVDAGTTSTSGPGTTANVPVTVPTTPSTEVPVAAEDNPPGDIPDNQAFVAYKAPSGFTVKIPEGWARVENGPTTSFTDKLNTIVLSWSSAAAAPSIDSEKSIDVPALQQGDRAFELVKISTTNLPAGNAVLVTYRVNSEPNSVTGKQYRLDVLRYSFYHQGLRVDVTLSSPVGADNVDPWNTVVRSLAW